MFESAGATEAPDQVMVLEPGVAERPETYLWSDRPPHKREPWDIQQWSAYHNERGPDGDVETLEFFAGYVAKFTRTREDVKTWADLLELDDFVSFGGKA